jgi:hypothetical protein
MGAPLKVGLENQGFSIPTIACFGTVTGCEWTFGPMAFEDITISTLSVEGLSFLGQCHTCNVNGQFG